MYVMYVCWSMCKLSDVFNVCMLKYVYVKRGMYVEVCVSYQMYVMYVCWSM